MGVVIKVGMADLKTGKNPDILTTLGLGSCIGIALWDPVTKIGGLAHVMLPDSTKIRNNSNIAKQNTLDLNIQGVFVSVTDNLRYLFLLCRRLNQAVHCRQGH